MKIRGFRQVSVVKSVACVAVAAGLFGAFPAVPSARAAEPVVAAAAAIDTSYDGIWVVTADADAPAEHGGRLDFTEYFNIESGVVTPQELSKLGFDPKAATFSTAADGTISWTVTLDSNSQGTLTITGSRASGGRMSGTLTWVRNGDTFKYAYIGTPSTPAPEAS
jgi:hypothetical protein